MDRRQGIAGFLIGIFLLNAMLCPCGPLPSIDDTQTVIASVDDPHARSHMQMGHAMPVDMVPADADAMADCHTVKAVDDCGMTDAVDPEATGKTSDRSLDLNKTAPSYAFFAGSSPLSSPSARLAPERQSPPPQTPIHNRDRLLI